MRLDIACIVEGDGEVQAVPVLLRRLAAKFFPEDFVYVARPIRIPRNRLPKTGELERNVKLAIDKTAGVGAILVLIDSDDDCAARLGPELLERAAAVRSGIPVSVVLCVREFEAWFLAAARSLRGHRGLQADLEPPPNPESIHDAKGWLARRMSAGNAYSPPVDQPKLAAVFDLEQARATRSFDRCYREVQRLLTILHTRQGGTATP
jgi:Domain of unknown function (DUF4276)